MRFNIGRISSSQHSSYYMRCNFLNIENCTLNYISHDDVDNFCLVPILSPVTNKLMVSRRYSIKHCWMNERMICNTLYFKYDGMFEKYFWLLIYNFKIQKKITWVWVSRNSNFEWLPLSIWNKVNGIKANRYIIYYFSPLTFKMMIYFKCNSFWRKAVHPYTSSWINMF